MHLHEYQQDLDWLHQLHHRLQTGKNMLHIVCFACLRIIEQCSTWTKSMNMVLCEFSNTHFLCDVKCRRKNKGDHIWIDEFLLGRMVRQMLHFFDYFQPLPGRAGPCAGQLSGEVGEELWAGPMQENIALVKHIQRATYIHKYM